MSKLKRALPEDIDITDEVNGYTEDELIKILDDWLIKGAYNQPDDIHDCKLDGNGEGHCSHPSHVERDI